MEVTERYSEKHSWWHGVPGTNHLSKHSSAGDWMDPAHHHRSSRSRWPGYLNDWGTIHFNWAFDNLQFDLIRSNIPIFSDWSDCFCSKINTLLGVALLRVVQYLNIARMSLVFIFLFFISLFRVDYSVQSNWFFDSWRWKIGNEMGRRWRIANNRPYSQWIRWSRSCHWNVQHW